MTYAKIFVECNIVQLTFALDAVAQITFKADACVGAGSVVAGSERRAGGDGLAFVHICKTVVVRLKK